MSGQKSILSFLSKTPKSVNKESPTEHSASNGKDDINKNGTPRGGKTLVTSTPKRKKSETPSERKKTKLSPKRNGRKRVEIEEDESFGEVEHGPVENVKSADSTLTGTSDGSFVSRSFQNESNITQNDDTREIHLDEAAVARDFEHTKLEFLKPELIRDINNRRPDDENYDPTTLYVPERYIKDQTPIYREWWKFKSKNYDKILLFKVGKFYELFHMDAVMAVTLLNLTFMKGGVGGGDKKKCVAHCGFPEIAFGRYADQLVQHGYKVARIEQTETPEMLQERNANTPGKKEKIVRRELCRIVTPGTKTYSYLDGDDYAGSPKYLLALCETADGSKRRYGVCFVDCAVGKIWLGEFDDDVYSSRLRTLLAQYPPAELFYTKKFITSPTENLLTTLNSCKLEHIAWKTQFLTASETLKLINSKKYFASDEEGIGRPAVDPWPSVLRETLVEGDLLGTTCRKECEMAIASLGAVIWYLEKCLIDDDILTLKLFEWYEPIINIDHSQNEASMDAIPALTSKTMILDSATLKNLDVIQSSSKANSIEGTLLELLDASCITAFGKRMLRHWLCNPLCQVSGIRERQQAIRDLLEQGDFSERASGLLKQMPDLERLLQKIHTIGLKKRLDHPDSRAVFFEAEKYNRRKVDEFLATLDGFHKVLEITKDFARISSQVDSVLLKRLLLTTSDATGRFPDLRVHLQEIESKFDRKRAEEEGIVVLSADLAKINAQINGITAEFDSYLQSQRKKLSCSNIKYCQVAKSRYMLEIPEAVAARVGSDYKFVGQIKGYRRFSTDHIEDLLDSLQKAEDQRDGAYRDSMRRVYETFSESHDTWHYAVVCIATLDVLLSLAQYVRNSEHPMCIPNVVNVGKEKPFIEIINGYHPCSSKIFTTLGQFVPNDTVLGKGDSAASVLLLTGPNMGGKSTLMRQVASLVILAQIGSYVPAESCSLSAVDRIFTRLGACDRLSAGESTFAVELTETKMILCHSTVHSLVVIDELGRGTATHDGAAIAYAVLKHLAGFQAGPRTLFSSHYHNLVARMSDYPNVALGHMACTVENEKDDDPSEETVTFLYKLAPGACPKSYGFHAAKLAGIQKQIVKRAYTKARETEATLELANRLRSLANDCEALTDEELVEAVGKLFISY